MIKPTYELLDEIRGVLSYEHDPKLRKLLNLCINHIIYLSDKVEALKEENSYLITVGNKNDYAPYVTVVLDNENLKASAKEMEEQRSQEKVQIIR